MNLLAAEKQNQMQQQKVAESIKNKSQSRDDKQSDHEQDER